MDSDALLGPKYVGLRAHSRDWTHRVIGHVAPTLGGRLVRRAPSMGSSFLPQPMPSRKLGSGPGSLGAGLGLPRLSLFSFSPLLYFRLGIPSPSPSPMGVLVGFVWWDFLGFFFLGLGPFYLDPSLVPQVFMVASSQDFVVLIYKTCKNT